MRILVCNWKDLAHPRAGGAEVWTHGIASAWVADGHTVTLACASAPGSPPRDERDGVEIVRGGDYRVGVHAHARHVYEQRNGKFDLVLDEINTRPFGAPAWAVRSEVVAFIHQVAREVWFHETPFPLALLGRYVLEPRWLRRYRGTRLFALSESTAMSLRAYGLDDAVVLPVASDLAVRPTQCAAKELTPTFIFCGRLSSMKRPLHAIAAFRILQQSFPQASLWMIGTGPEADRVRRKAGDGVEMLGNVSRSERDELMSRAHALIATSVREGWGLVVSEAAAVGTSTIGYEVPGLVDSVRATGGRLVRPNPADLATEMACVAGDLSNLPTPTGTGTVACRDVARSLMSLTEVGAHG